MVSKSFLIGAINVSIRNASAIVKLEVSDISENKSRDGVNSLGGDVIKGYTAYVLQQERRPKFIFGKTDFDIVQFDSFGMTDKEAMSRQLSEH